ncbi:hypothetical protein L227DRAFT_618094 [Lentinus tigrinus ALCF2SS1-6]|uniref:Uncharacterized protein n=1 Tax=Lentinus tigrinus ALCF2SS1-6 TaxID=1328759 RepID=A0A5C2RLY2_9APHY|nr:hypothetical protein L227DRAFT_618094 [Lentinus tigrinus ALCF2SS1-6]
MIAPEDAPENAPAGPTRDSAAQQPAPVPPGLGGTPVVQQPTLITPGAPVKARRTRVSAPRPQSSSQSESGSTPGRPGSTRSFGDYLQSPGGAYRGMSTFVINSLEREQPNTDATLEQGNSMLTSMLTTLGNDVKRLAAEGGQALDEMDQFFKEQGWPLSAEGL